MATRPGVLAIDIGGTGLKAAVVDAQGKMLSDRLRVPTPQPCPPPALIKAVAALVRPLPAYDRISIGFPGVIRNQCVVTAPNLGTEQWAGFALAAALSKRLGGYPARMVNDAEMQGFALIDGKGLELAITLGTGFGTALFRDGLLMPHLELSQHPIHNGKTYDQYLGNAELKRVGKKRWNKRVRTALELIEVLMYPTRIIVAGGNARRVDERDLPKGAIIGSNDVGIHGGAALWRKGAPAVP